MNLKQLVLTPSRKIIVSLYEIKMMSNLPYQTNLFVSDSLI